VHPPGGLPVEDVRRRGGGRRLGSAAQARVPFLHPVKLAALFLIATAGVATAQPAPPPTPTADVGAPPTQWVDWDLSGQLIPGDDVDTLKGLLKDTMETHRALTPSAEDEIREACKTIGYEVLRIDTPPAAGGGVKAVLVLDPIPMIRSVDVVVHE